MNAPKQLRPYSNLLIRMGPDKLLEAVVQSHAGNTIQSAKLVLSAMSDDEKEAFKATDVAEALGRAFTKNVTRKDLQVFLITLAAEIAAPGGTTE